MTHNKNYRPAPSENEQANVMTFQFSESKKPIRNLLFNGKPWFVAKDVCDILGLSDTNMSLKHLDEDEKLIQKIFGSGQNRKMWVISESGLYALILRSNKPYAKTFRKWITSEVIPALLKKGCYYMHRPIGNYIDARDVPFETIDINGYQVRSLMLNNGVWVVINDVNKAIHCSTSSHQLAKKLNAKQQLAIKIWLFGNTHPAWCTNKLGLQLLLAGSRKRREIAQLELSFSLDTGKEANHGS